MSQRLRMFADTTPEAEEFLLAALAELPGWRRWEMMGQLNAQMRAAALAGVRDRHPHAGPAEQRRRLADILLGPALAAEVLGPLELAVAQDQAAAMRAETTDHGQ